MNAKPLASALALLLTAMMLSTCLPATAASSYEPPAPTATGILEQAVAPVAIPGTDSANVTATIKASSNEWIASAECVIVQVGDDPVTDGTTYTMTTTAGWTAKTKEYFFEFVPYELVPALAPMRYEIYVRGYFVSTQGGSNYYYGSFGDPMDFEVLHDGPVVSSGPLAAPSIAPVSVGTFELTATISDGLTGGQNIIAAEYFVDAVDISGGGQAMAFVDGANSPLEAVRSTISVSDFIQDWGVGVHTIFVHGRDSSNAWGPYKSVMVETDDDLGPEMKTIAVSPDPTNGAAMVDLEARADDSATGMSNIAAAEYFLYQAVIAQVQSAAGTGTAMYAQDGAFSSSNEVVYAGISVTGLALGTYRVFVHAMDSQGNWGAYINTTFVINDDDYPYFEGIKQVANPGTGTELDLSWDPADDPSTPITYKIYMAATSGGENYATPSATTQGTLFTYTSLTPGLTYYFVVRAEDAQGNEDPNTIELWGMPQADAAAPAFAGVQSVVDTEQGGELVVSWNAATDSSVPISYNVYIGTAPGGQDFGSPAATTTGLTITLTGLTNDVTHYVVVRAVDYPGNEDSNTVEISATPTFVDVTDPVFAGVYQVVDGGTGSALVLNWTAAIDQSPVSYSIFMSLSASVASFNFAIPSTTTQYTTYTYGSLTPGITYYFIVRAKDAFSNEEFNTVVKYAMVQFPDTTAPTFAGLASAVSLDSGTEARLTWVYATDSTPPIAYNVYQATAPGAEDFGTPVTTTLLNATVIGGLTPGLTYYFVVRAEDSRGNEDSNTVERSVLIVQPVDTAPPAFAGLSSAVDLADGGRVSLSWSAAVEAQSPPVRYYVYWSQTPAPIDYGVVRMNLTAATGAVVDGLVNDAQYRFAVRAVDALWNVDSNAVTHTATPTDSTPPVLGSGAVEVADTENEGELYISWPAADDNSGPVTYNVYYATQPGVIVTGVPAVTTTSTSATLTGLDDATTYYIVVVAEDAEGNTEEMAEASGTTAEKSTGFLWYAAIVGGILLLLVLLVLVAFGAFYVAKRVGGGKPHHREFGQPEGAESLDDMEAAEGKEESGGKSEK